MSGVVIGSTGKDSIRYILEEYNKYDAYIIIIDRGISDKDYDILNNTITNFKIKMKKVPIFIFQPKCIEEILISFYDLNKYIELNNCESAIKLHNELRMVLKGKLNEINYNEYKTLEISTPEQIYEQLIYELTNNTPFKCYHGQRGIKNKQPRIQAYMSPCWRCACCTVEKYDNMKYVNVDDCKSPNINKNKMDYIASKSLLCGLTYIIDKIYGFHFHNTYWKHMSRSFFNKLVKEL